ncbi:MAG: FAD-dependent oxidoreductase [Coriobacteriales bacterium]|nr:FAD-dependent oxidoreductase [Coriobacteriales bacterium]
MSMDRRSFLKGAAVAGGAAALVSLGACAPAGGNDGGGGGSGQEEEKISYDTIGTYTADVCVVGTGMSGLAAAVQACEDGLSVVALEKSGFPGAGSYGVEGIFAINSKAQMDAGCEEKPYVDYIPNELDYSHYRADGSKWVDLFANCGDNVDWLIQQGVDIIPYDLVEGATAASRFGAYMTYNQDRQLSSYIRPMYKKAQELGAEVLVNTRAVDIIKDEAGVVTGIVAQKADQAYIQVNAKAIILCTGGYTCNDEYCKEAGVYDPEQAIRFIPDVNGDGLTLARKVGGADFVSKASMQLYATVAGGPGGEYGTFGNGNALVVASRSPNNLWVNEKGRRFTSEVVGTLFMARGNILLSQKAIYSIFDQKTWEINFYGGLDSATAYFLTKEWQYDEETSKAQFEERFEQNPYNDAFKANTLEELVELAAANFEDMDKDVLLRSINDYNEVCKAGVDDVFGKAAESLVPFDTPPYYIIHQVPSIMNTYGGISTNSRFEVIDADRKPVPGLYSAGTDGVDLWQMGYRGGGYCGATNVNSGRISAKSAKEYIGSTVIGSVAKEGDTSSSIVPYSYDMPSGLKDGVYNSKEFQGMNGWIKATVTVEGGKIAEIVQENELETKYVGVYAMDDMIEEILAKQDVNVDTVAGATATSNGFRSAVEDALAQAAE